ncbi:bifunctional [glutamate--ammonia ligase]-adenylyl-L-tyrosine phosphorylase/[glutamate--ammonia-ligase] adenylyltransferase [Ectothiorhodospira lacustris]|uniref:bifunctional [glutamate--ammonia ligase]-adenylyl-L-tyrosine phosphorylase/[glutamate--ammonia-ligase] adenylyltransferase n=1 Tax=Ectothiorhodospira lacustris TaxID=2899127 RepID=UPI001EE79C30|nr:bifunctional [glutamate--ammonia ligase]-adenylyl-L-tyrosine phosphorylase/[glutamate--ammonia-ligase] adenylyltransferase [Ectothiorhodospira lacustris]MCG5501650.1 bifunctional [glutamate--ammonia ligase]-adenylyl-L-tyrosine phosphorylase/[glutamate--ammonia-ligase] adenylyltransferase [Ectothiorhodospira lacustris]MCG5509901.1 bifunctional [glutamate--ammonia ligase]-adenylyl-L-tyrosine phosphorylase/[glutamate--ammonia-ligase] adenylyltransferase [Ectothiorhodospira lacustris]MCG5521155.1
MTTPTPQDLCLDGIPQAARPGLLNLAEDYLSACRGQGLSPGPWPEALAGVWYYSDFVARTAIRHPDRFLALLDSGDLERAYADGDMRRRVRDALETAEDEAGLMRLLRQARNREMVRIAWRDLTGTATLDETLRDLSTLADHLIDGALDWLHADMVRRHGEPGDADGQPQRLVVLGMGKLGGHELNFSSDIDLIFAYPRTGETDGERCLDNSQFFIRLGQRLIKVLNEKTPDGFVYRVDMRLRPFGDTGPLVMSFDALEDYYESHGREWERYALIKARAVAGDRDSAQQLYALLRPFIYRRYLDFGAFGSLRDMKALINREAARKGKDQDIKLGEGGIREVEFVGQAFQLIRAGRDPSLQLRGIRPVLERLAAQDLMPAYAVRHLLEAYDFLRRTENRLQMVADQQTHRLPREDGDRLRLALSMGFDDWNSFENTLSRHMRRVHGQFEQVFAAPQRADEDGEQAAQPEAQRDLAALWLGSLDRDRSLAILGELGLSDPERALAGLEHLRDSSACRSLTATGRERLDRLMPLMVGLLTGLGASDVTLERLLRLVQTIARRSVYLSLLVENPLALSQLARLCEASPWIADHLTRYPLLLDELLDPRSLYAPPGRQGLMDALNDELVQVPQDDLEQVMDRLRMFKQVQVLKVAAADIMDVLPVMKVSDHLTWIAEVVLERVLSLVLEQLVARHGRPRCLIDGAPYEPGFAVVGYGKLGGLELGYGSDLDIVFLHDSRGERAMTDGERPLDNSEFFARVGQRILHFLGVFTGAGRLYEVDTRLRPSGASGLLVTSVAAFEDYQRHSAWTWEHQALVRARPVAGDARIAEAFQAMRARVLQQPRDEAALCREVREMREKMWKEHATRDPAWFDLKRDPGGIADIEFMVQYLVLAHAGRHPQLTTWPDNIRILESLIETGLMSRDDALFLMDTYRSFRDRIHELTLQELPARVPASDWAREREQVRAFWRRLMT